METGVSRREGFEARRIHQVAPRTLGHSGAGEGGILWDLVRRQVEEKEDDDLGTEQMLEALLCP